MGDLSTKKTILVIDDDLAVRQSLAFFFQDQDFNVLSAGDGRQGLDMFFNHNVDIVLTDLRMPETDGIEVMQTIRKEKPDIPMIVVSGHGGREDIIKALRMGAKDYITKPVTDFDTIGNTVDRALEISRLNRENRRYRKYIEKSEKLYRTIAENIAEGVISLNKKAGIIYTNQAFCRMTGYTQDEILHKNLKELTPPGTGAVIEQILTLNTEPAARYEVKIHDKSGKPFHAELVCRSIVEDDTHQGTIVLVRDITPLIALREKYKSFIKTDDSRKENVIPICASCKSIRIEKGKWLPVERYFSHMEFSHGICKACCDKLYPNFDFSDKNSS